MRRAPNFLARPRSAAALAILAAGAFGGCIKYKDRTVLLPDGSGKFSLSIAMKSALLEMAESQAKKDGGEAASGMLDMDPDRLRKDFEGIVAFAEPVKKAEGDWTHITVTGYFEDVNKVRMWKDGDSDDAAAGAAAPRELMIGFKFAKEGDGFVLEQTSGMFNDMAELGDAGDTDDPDMSPEMKKMAADMAKAMLKGMFEGMEITSAVEMPGKVTKAEGHEPKEGRLASTSVTLDDILDDAKREKLKTRKSIKVWCGASDLTAEQVKTFRDEMAAAKTAWAKTVADYEAKKKAAGGDGPKAPPDPMGPK